MFSVSEENNIWLSEEIMKEKDLKQDYIKKGVDPDRIPQDTLRLWVHLHSK